MNRRGFLGGLLALAAPAIIRTPGLLMPIKPCADLLFANIGAGWFPLPPLKMEGRVSAYDPNFTPEEYLAMRQRFSRAVHERIKDWRGHYAEV